MRRDGRDPGSDAVFGAHCSAVTWDPIYQLPGGEELLGACPPDWLPAQFDATREGRANDVPPTQQNLESRSSRLSTLHIALARRRVREESCGCGGCGSEHAGYIDSVICLCRELLSSITSVGGLWVLGMVFAVNMYFSFLVDRHEAEYLIIIIGPFRFVLGIFLLCSFWIIWAASQNTLYGTTR